MQQQLQITPPTTTDYPARSASPLKPLFPIPAGFSGDSRKNGSYYSSSRIKRGLGESQRLILSLTE